LTASPATIRAGSAKVTVTLAGQKLPKGFDNMTAIWLNCDASMLPTVDPAAASPAAQKQQVTFIDADHISFPLDQQFLQKAGTVIIATKQTACSATQEIVPSETLAIINVTGGLPPGEAPKEEILVGVDVTGVSSASPNAEFLGLGLFDLNLKYVPDLTAVKDDSIFWLSGYVGIKAMGQPGSLSSSQSAGYFATAANATPDKIVQSVDLSLHLGMQFHTWQLNPDARDGQAKFASLSFIVGGGAITPLSASQSNPQVYEATPLILQTQTPVAPFTSFASSCSANPTAAPTCYVTFVPTDRTHFYRNYDAGLRLKLYEPDTDHGGLRFPGFFDLTLGQNEYVTGGTFQKLVMHLAATFPLPLGKALDEVYAFGSMDLGLSKMNSSGPQLQLIPAPATAGALTSASPSVYTISTSQPNRDRYQLGFGIDILHFIQNPPGSKKKN
jgi:hypothetical protein